MLAKLARLLEARSDEILQTIVSEVGHPASIAAQPRSAPRSGTCDIAAESPERHRWDEQVGQHRRAPRMPAGVVGAITPWNAPLQMICMKAGAAIAAGCTVVLKGSEVAPLSSFIFAEAAAEAGLPDGVFNLVCGTGPEVGEAIASHPLVDMVSLTGSVRAGRRVMELAAAVDQASGAGAGREVSQHHPARRRPRARRHRRYRRCVPQRRPGLRQAVPHPRPAAAAGRGRGDRRAQGRELRPRRPVRPRHDARPGRDGRPARAGPRLHPGPAMDEGARLLTGGPEAPAGLPRGYFVRPTVFVRRATACGSPRRRSSGRSW